MIWKLSSPDTAASEVVRRIADGAALAYDTQCPLNEMQIGEVARAVECFLDARPGVDGGDSRQLFMLVSRALGSLGEAEAARRLFLFGTGMVRPAEWEVTGRAAMWVLDLRQLSVWEDAPLEMVFFSSIDVILDWMAGLWDPSEGGGVLGLRHVCSAATGLLGQRARKRALNALSAEVIRHCTDRLSGIGRSRGWTACPHVMSLDL